MTRLAQDRAEEYAATSAMLHAELRATLTDDADGRTVDEACVALDRSPSALARRMSNYGDPGLARLLWRQARAWTDRGGWAACQDEAVRAEVAGWLLEAAEDTDTTGEASAQPHPQPRKAGTRS